MEQGYRSAGWKGAREKALEVRLVQHKAGPGRHTRSLRLMPTEERKRKAFKRLGLAYQERDPGVLPLKMGFLLDSLRPDRRLTDLVSKVGLPQWGLTGGDYRTCF